MYASSQGHHPRNCTLRFRPRHLWEHRKSQNLSSNIRVSVRPDIRYCFRSGRFCPNPRTKHISIPPRHMTKSYIPDFNMISQHYRYKGTHLIQSAYNCLNTIHQRKIHVWVQTTNKCLMAKVKHTVPTSTRVQALRRDLVVVESPRRRRGTGSPPASEVQRLHNRA